MRDDLIIPFQVGDGAVRGRIIRLGKAIDAILRPHDFPAPASELLGEAAMLAALMGSSLKFDGKLIFQAQGEGPVRLLVSDYASSGALRATATIHGPVESRGLPALMGNGHLALTIDQGPDMERYQGVTPLEGGTLEEAAIRYFAQSEQIPTNVRLAVGHVRRAGEEEQWRAGGLMIQLVPAAGGDAARGEHERNSPDAEEAFERASALLATTQPDELLDPELSPENLLYRLFHEDGVRVFEAKTVRAECSCNAGKIEAVLSRYAPEEMSDLLEDGRIKVSCEFCRRDYYFNAEGRETPR